MFLLIPYPPQLQEPNLKIKKNVRAGELRVNAEMTVAVTLLNAVIDR
jgi:hypothetical protein